VCKLGLLSVLIDRMQDRFARTKTADESLEIVAKLKYVGMSKISCMKKLRAD